MEKIHGNMHVVVLFKHESTKTCMFPCKLHVAVAKYIATKGCLWLL